MAASGQGPGFTGRAAATRAAGGEGRRGGGVCPSAGGRAWRPAAGRPRSRPRGGGGVSGPSEMRDCPLGSEWARAEGCEAGLRPGAVWLCPRHSARSGLAREAPGAGSGSESPGFPHGE